jgi:hypothetical protein
LSPEPAITTTRYAIVACAGIYLSSEIILLYLLWYPLILPFSLEIWVYPVPPSYFKLFPTFPNCCFWKSFFLTHFFIFYLDNHHPN